MRPFLLLLGVVLCWAVLIQGDITMDISAGVVTNLAAQALPGRPIYIYENRRHSVVKRDLLHLYLKEHFLYSFLPDRANANSYLLMDAFAGVGIHHQPGRADPRNPGSPVMMLDAALSRGFVPNFWFNEPNAQINAHLTYVVGKLAAANGRLVGRTHIEQGDFSAKFAAKVQASTQVHIFAHVDPYDYTTVTWPHLRELFLPANNHGGAYIRSLQINLFTRGALGDLLRAVKPAPRVLPRPPPVIVQGRVIDRAHIAAALPTAFGYADGPAFMTDMIAKSRQVHGHVSNAAAETAILTQLIAANQPIDARRRHYEEGNRVARLLATMYASQLRGIDGTVKTAAPIALIGDDHTVMDWAIFASNLQTHVTAFERELQHIKPAADVSNGASYFHDTGAGTALPSTVTVSGAILLQQSDTAKAHPLGKRRFGLRGRKAGRSLR